MQKCVVHPERFHVSVEEDGNSCDMCQTLSITTSQTRNIRQKNEKSLRIDAY
jgi:hypothetical protein